MNKATKRRLRRVEETLGSMPIPLALIREALERFKATGELPEDEDLGYLVFERIQAGDDARFDVSTEMGLAEAFRHAIEAKPRPDDPLMTELYCEAIFAHGLVREAARTVLRTLSELGLDPSAPLFAGHMIDIPGWGGVGLHLMGIPKGLIQPPYEDQARRLFARYEALRGQVPQGDDAWREQFGSAVGAFQELGELPDPGLMRDVVLADAELRALAQHACGRDVSEVMAALDAVGQGTGAAQEAALAHFLALAREGRLRPKAEPGSGE